MNSMNEYYEALERLINNKPINVPINSKINNDTVALEARRKRGSIKKSIPISNELINKIDKANNEKTFNVKKLEIRIKNTLNIKCYMKRL